MKKIKDIFQLLLITNRNWNCNNASLKSTYTYFPINRIVKHKIITIKISIRENFQSDLSDLFVDKIYFF